MTLPPEKTRTPARRRFKIPFRITALASLVAGSLFALGTPASAQTLSITVGSDGYRTDNTRYSSSRTIYCASEDRRYESCNLGGNVSRVYLQDRRSDASCYEGRDWGYDRNRIWVRNGCRAVFGVVYGGSYGGYDDRRYGDNRRYDPPAYGRPGTGRGYGGDLTARRDQAVRACIALANDRLRGYGNSLYRFDGVNYARPDRDGYGWTIGLDYDYGRGYRSSDRDIICLYERGQARLTSFNYRRDEWDRRGRDQRY